MVCPYRVVVSIVTIVVAAAMTLGTEWLADYFPSWAAADRAAAKTARAKGIPFKDRSRWHRAVWFGVIALLIFFHAELFTGGAFCRYLFASSSSGNTTAGIAEPVLAIPSVTAE